MQAYQGSHGRFDGQRTGLGFASRKPRSECRAQMRECACAVVERDGGRHFRLARGLERSRRRRLGPR